MATLSPIALTPHQPQWEKWGREEINHLSKMLHEFSPVINHIGSTAVAGIQSKPIIDILVEIPHEINLRLIEPAMETAGYIMMSSSDNRISFNKGYTPAGYAEKVFHIHCRHSGDNDEIYFRDYLRNNPAIAREYESLKLSLLPQYRNDRDGYTEAKSAFIKRITTLARRQDK